MRILQIYADWKWTGPSEPILNLTSGLSKSGHQVYLACYAPPAKPHNRTLPQMAISRGIQPLLLRPQDSVLNIGSIIRNVRILTRFIRNNPVDVIHCHSSQDHLLASRIKLHPRIIRTNHKGAPLPNGRRLLRNNTDAYITLSEKLRAEETKVFGLPNNKVWAIDGAIDLSPFVSFKSERPEYREELSIKPDDIVVGIIARVQRHRRFEILLEAMRLAVKQVPTLKLLVIGRGTYYQEILVKPVKKMGLTANVILGGYRKDDYLPVVDVMDFGVFLVPGSDGSCRAVREMMALGKPVIVARRGILPEIIEDGLTGLVVDDTPGNLADSFIRLSRDRGLVRKMGDAARERAFQQFSIEQQVRKVEQVYRFALRQ